MTASATRGVTRLVGVIIGSNDSKTRFAEMSSLFNYGFSNFESKLLIDKEVPVTMQNFKNAKNAVSIYPEEDVNVFLKKNEEFVYSTGFEVYDLKAPINQGYCNINPRFFQEEIREIRLIKKQDRQLHSL